MLRIVNIPNPVLTNPSKPVVEIDKKVKQLVKDMEATLVIQQDPEGVGLAAPQVGIDLQLFIIKPTRKAATEVFINPKIIELAERKASANKEGEKKKEKQLEGCLSVPRIWSPIVRPYRVQLEYLNLMGEKQTNWFTGFKATIIQHEVDHLDGILFTQRALEQNTSLYEEKDGELKKMELK